MSIVSFFDQFPEYNGVKFHFRGSDGYCKVSSLNKAMGGKRFADWMKTKFAQSVVGEISKQTGIPINTEFQEKGGRLSTLSSNLASYQLALTMGSALTIPTYPSPPV